MKLYLTRRYTFEAAHRLIGMRDRHRCSRPHGHNYAVELTITGPLLNGLIIDVGDLDVSVAPVIARLDHNDLNEIAKGDGPISILTQPSVENIARYLLEALDFLSAKSMGGWKLHRVRVYENASIWADAVP